MKTGCKRIIFFFAVILLSSAIILPLTNAKSSESEGLFLGDYEAQLRIGALGGTVQTEDTLSPLYGSSLSVPLRAYRKDDGKFGFITYQASVPSTGADSAGTVSGANNNILTINSSASIFEGTSIGTIRSGNILVLYFDSNGDNEIDQFPAYFITKNDDAKKQIEVLGSLPDTGKIIIVQAIEPPQFSILSVTNPFNWPNKVKKAKKRKVMSVGVPIGFTIADTKHSGFLRFKGKRIDKFDNKVSITVPYNNELITKLGLNANNLRVYKLSGNSFRAVEVKSIDTAAGTVTVKTKKLSIYQAVIPYKERNSISYVHYVKVKAKGNKAKIKYRLADPTHKPSSVKIEYRKLSDPGSDWVEIATKKSVKPGNNKYKWKVGGLKTGHYQVRVTPTKTISGSAITMTGNASPAFYVKNGSAGADSPGGLEATVDNSVTPPQVSLSWDDESGASSYNIYRQARFDTGGFEKTLLPITNTTGTTFNDTTIPSSFYEGIYMVTSLDSSGRESPFVSARKQLKLASKVLSGYGGYYYGS